MYRLADDKRTVSCKRPRGEYKGCFSTENDVYCRYTIARFSHDPFAKWQHPAMFGQEDANSRMLDKDPKGSWIVAPIVRPNNAGGSPELLGFISADSHEQISGAPKDRPDLDSRLIALQCPDCGFNCGAREARLGYRRATSAYVREGCT